MIPFTSDWQIRSTIQCLDHPHFVQEIMIAATGQQSAFSSHPSVRRYYANSVYESLIKDRI